MLSSCVKKVLSIAINNLHGKWLPDPILLCLSKRKREQRGLEEGERGKRIRLHDPPLFSPWPGIRFLLAIWMSNSRSAVAQPFFFFF